MNFLSHFYLHNEPDDNFYSVGLTLPDLLGFHSRRVRITKKVLLSLRDKAEDMRLHSLIDGMEMHLEVDRWFHRHDFFKKGLVLLQKLFNEASGGSESLPHFFAHILVEILLDRYLLNEHPSLGTRIYSSYREFDFEDTVPLLEDLPEFDAEKYLDLTEKVANSTFLTEYTDDEAVLSILHRVSGRTGVPVTFGQDSEMVKQFFRDGYEVMLPHMPAVYEEAIDLFPVRTTLSS
jgi:hypothetical protein